MWFRYFGVDKCNFVLLNSIRILRFEEAYNDEQSFALVDDMTLQAPFLGQGIVGEVASTGNHQWLFSDTLFQTIAIIPLGSSGLVQLGSTQKILESTEILEQTTRALQETC
ncbi:hypothetical protein AXX17_AT5G24180 [Arabidopsis thaliana]|uniref:Transcription factor MYC/MYB N-terminal domain-containing protein n=1 Tax=Arabidopsis thaliana TaxID=3702 RepID=A0A178UIE4_ARATH|nr:hypothetical protein AXX17_AT5G24180 [Arabidopsis thaliana]